MKLPLLLAFSLSVAALNAQSYDLVLKGGHVMDPKNNLNGVMDVAISGGQIARVEANIPAAQAQKVVDVGGLYVTPGLVDMHVHLYASTSKKGAYSGDLSLYPDGFTLRSGVTTAVDLGSSGWKNFPDFKEHVIDRAKTRVFAMLNIIGSGMGGGAIEQNTGDMDPEATARVAKQYPDVIVGIKTAHFQAPEWIAVDSAVAAGKLADIPVVVDFGRPWPQRTYVDLVTRHLRPGDMSTHVYSTASAPLVDDHGKVLPALLEARKRGVKFDVGHGGGSFVWFLAVPAIRAGWVPDSISTDLHVGSMNAGMKDMPTTMSKILNLGVPLYDVIRMSTINPATQIRRPQYGHLSVGAGADVAVLRLDKGQFGFQDARGARLTGTQKLICEMTIRDGKVVWDLNGRAGEDWQKYYADPAHRKPPPPRVVTQTSGR
jgi:dihydroorotase